MSDCSPIKFWNEYAKNIIAQDDEKPTQARYRSKPEWTKWSKQAAIAAIGAFTSKSEQAKPEISDNFELKQRCYLQLDCCGYTDFAPDGWQIRIAYEHEHDPKWKHDICKLAHIWADLRVLIAYWDFAKAGGTDSLKTKTLENLQALEKKEYRITRIPGEWLFIFGPSETYDERYPYVAYELDAKRGGQFSLKELRLEGEALNPCRWQ